MAQNIIINGAEFPDVPSIIVPKASGGSAEFFDMSSDIAWMGLDAELLDDVFSDTLTLAETTYPSWTPSTTAKAIKATANIGTFHADFTKYEYMLLTKALADIVCVDGTTLKACPVRQAMCLHQYFIKRENSLANIQSKNDAGNVCINLATSALMTYYNTSGALTYTFASSYGFYVGATAGTFSSSTSDAPTVTLKTPTWNARCSNTYFTTTMAKAVDQEASTLKRDCKLYRFRKGSLMKAITKEVVDLFDDGI